jgi:hypothetical protein
VRVPPGAWLPLYTCDGTDKRSGNSKSTSVFEFSLDLTPRYALILQPQPVQAERRQRLPRKMTLQTRVNQPVSRFVLFNNVVLLLFKHSPSLAQWPRESRRLRNTLYDNIFLVDASSESENTRELCSRRLY